MISARLKQQLKKRKADDSKAEDGKALDKKKRKNAPPKSLQDLLGPYKPCKFKLAASKVLFVGVMPASKCDPDKPGTDATTRAATKQLGFTPDWFDILPVSPDCPFGEIGFQRIAEFIETTHTKEDKQAFLDGIHAIVDAGATRCIYFCGEVVRHYVGLPDNCDDVRVWTTPRGTTCLVVQTGYHPSWHLVSARNPVAVEAYRRDMALVSVCASIQDAMHLSEDAL